MFESQHLITSYGNYNHNKIAKMFMVFKCCREHGQAGAFDSNDNRSDPLVVRYVSSIATLVAVEYVFA